VQSLFHLVDVLGTHWVAAVAAVLLIYLGIAMFVALFSNDKDRAERAKDIFSEMLRALFWWRSR
jgi:putative Mn2+ efflux pump MntP